MFFEFYRAIDEKRFIIILTMKTENIRYEVQLLSNDSFLFEKLKLAGVSHFGDYVPCISLGFFNLGHSFNMIEEKQT